MKNTFIMYAKYMKRADQSVLNLLDQVPWESRAKDSGSYYKSLHGLMIHLLGGTAYFLKLFNDKNNIHERIGTITIPKTIDDESSYLQVKRNISFINDLTIEYVESLTEKELSDEIGIDWYADRKTVPFHFLFNQLFVTNIHHRGQISQILDELKIDHDFSSIDLEFLNLRRSLKKPVVKKIRLFGQKNTCTFIVYGS